MVYEFQTKEIIHWLKIKMPNAIFNIHKSPNKNANGVAIWKKNEIFCELNLPRG